MYELIKNNYIELFNKYCLYNRNVIKNSKSNEDLFNDKILLFMNFNIPSPTLEMLTLFLSERIKNKSKKFIEYKDSFIQEVEELNEFEEKINLLFIDYRPEKK